MDKETFVERVCQGVKKGMPKELMGARMRAVYECKEDGGSALLQLIRPWSRFRVCFVMEGFYQDYSSGCVTVESVVAYILNNRSLYYVPIDVDKLEVFDFENIRGRIVSRIVSGTEHNGAYLRNRPKKFICGTSIAQIWEIDIADLCYDKTLEASIPVTWDLLCRWEVSVKEIERIASRNTPCIRPLFIGDIRNKKVIVSNQRKSNGAAAVMYSGVREKLTKMLCDDVYIIPLSVHECLVIPKSKADVPSLYHMV